MNPADPPPGDQGSDHLEATASGHARIYQARRDLYVSEHDLHVHYVDGVRSARRVVQGDAGPQECPYPGLEAFGPQQAQWFRGRDTLIADLLVRVDERLRDGGALAVVAPSGAGKSSLLKAGLLPAIARGALPVAGSSQWPRLVFTPGSDPQSALATHLAHAVGLDPAHLRRMVAGDEAGGVLLRRALGGRRLVMVIDQLEELFAPGIDEQTRHRFLDVLAALAAPGPAGEPPLALVVYGLRSDFYSPCAGYPQLRAALQGGQLLVGPMSEAELREAILYPAKDVQLEVEPGLIDVLLRDLGAGADGTSTYEAGRLPLLAHALRVTWQQRQGSWLTTESYAATRGIAHAIATTAEDLYTGLAPPAQQAAHTMFLRLVRIGDGADDTRRRVPYGDLLAKGDDSVAVVVERFTGGRLLSREQDNVEITHEVLLRAWPRLRRWIKEDRAENLVRQELEEAAAGWERGRRDAGMLYRGQRLETARAWARASDAGRAGPSATEFLTASVRLRNRAARVRRTVLAVLSVLALIASGAAVVAFQQRATARSERDSAIFTRLTAQADSLRDTQTSLAAQLDLAAHRMRPTPELRTRLMADAHTSLSTPLAPRGTSGLAVAFRRDGRVLADAWFDGTVRLWSLSDAARPRLLTSFLVAPEAAITHLGFSPDGRVLVTAGDREVRLWSVSDPAHPAALSQLPNVRAGPVKSLALSADGRTLATGWFDGTVRLWDLKDPARPGALGGPLAGHADAPSVNTLAFSPDGRTLAGGRGNGTVRLWSLTDPAHPRLLRSVLSGHSQSVRSVAFRPDGRVLASASSSSTVLLWNLDDPARPKAMGQALNGHTSTVYAVAFSPDGRTLVSAGADNTVRLWNLADPSRPRALGRPLTDHTAPVYAVAFTPDGRTVASASNDGTVRLWSLPGSVTSGHNRQVYSVAFSPDGRTLASGGADRVVRLWNVADPAHPKALAGPLPHTNAVYSVAFSPDGRTLASGGADRVVRLWNVADPTHPKALAEPLPHTNAVDSVAFSPHGHMMASGVAGGTVRLWSLADSAHPTPIGRPFRAHNGVTRSVAFSPDGRTLASVGEDNHVMLWNITDPAHPTLQRVLFTLGGRGDSVVFSPDGRTLASAGDDHTVHLWDTSDLARRKPADHPLTRHSSEIYSVAFSPDGRTLASAATDHTVRLWVVTDPSHPTPLGDPLTDPTNWVYSVAFSPDGRHLAVGGEDQRVQLWPLRTDQAIRQICATSGTLTRNQWQQYIPERPYAPPCTGA
ncbi:hypothetical protein ACH4SP_04760 [Streptomyces sp. NPDC021093]|uniref:nSTAND1 domain-containing NTPase n=1 Tax=Streptomyces sp. NPDC021093 TaxID=3365112 RepID=UPI0037A14FC8